MKNSLQRPKKAGLGCCASTATKPQILTRLDALKYFLYCHIWVRLRLPADFLNFKGLISLGLTVGYCAAAEP